MSRPTYEIKEYREVITALYQEKGRAALLSGGEVADLIAYDMASYEAYENFTSKDADAVIAFLAWKRRHAYEARGLEVPS